MGFFSENFLRANLSLSQIKTLEPCFDKVVAISDPRPDAAAVITTFNS